MAWENPLACGGMKVIDSHTEGEPTRVIITGGPDLGNGTLAERVQRFAAEFDHIRQAVILEPRGSDIMVPMAIPSFGGMLVAIITTLLVPVLYSLVKELSTARGERQLADAVAR